MNPDLHRNHVVDDSQRIQPISHTGPGMAYLSKAPGSLEIYRGDGDWFKIGELSAKSDTKWIISSQNGPVSHLILLAAITSNFGVR